MDKINQGNKGSTLSTVLITIVVLVVLVVGGMFLAWPKISQDAKDRTRSSAHEASLYADLYELRNAIVQFEINTDRQATNLEEIFDSDYLSPKYKQRVLSNIDEYSYSTSPNQVCVSLESSQTQKCLEI